MWDTYSEDKPKSDIGRIVRIALFAVIGIIIFTIVSNQSVSLFMNVVEFGTIFTKPLYYSIISGLILASISLVRVNFKARHSITWYSLKSIIGLLKRTDFESSTRLGRYSDYKMSKVSFAVWQLTKVVLFAPLFGNLMFGIAAEYLLQGNDFGLASIPNIFSIPFANIPMNGSFANENVIPAFAPLTLVIPPLLAAIGLRLFLYIGVAGAVNIISQYMVDTNDSKPKFLSYISKAELIIGSAIFWIGFTMFFSSGIDYNTKYAISGALVLGLAFIAFGFFDRRRAKVIIYPSKSHLYSRLLAVVVVAVIVGSIMAVNKSIADVQKIDWIGPYNAQEIAVNRYMAELDEITVVNYDVKSPSVPASRIDSIVAENRETLNNIRLWDKDAATSKLKPELGQKNDINFADIDILRFGDTMYWTGTTTPNLPQDVAQGNVWYNQHLVYTHVNKGMLMLEADTGNVVDENKFFEQKRIYYGESGSTGIFDKAWSAYPVGRERSEEIDQFFYNGTGGIDVAPPLSWIFEPNFMVSYPSTPIHIMRYKDIHERMELLYPYFIYGFSFGNLAPSQLTKIDVIPVSDGTNSYWLMPLIVALDTSHVPWGSEFMLKHTGYALIDTFNGDVQIFVTGDDYFSKLFLEQYESTGATTEIPEWLSKQIRYPEEMFLWKILRFNFYHVTDPKTFIEAKQFYAIPREVAAYYIITKPQGFEEPEFIGFQSLELSNSPAKNLVGYMTVENDLPSLGNMTFYSVPLDSPTKLLGPSAAKEALDKDADYLEIKTLLQGRSKTGENILYRMGDQEVYFIPVYTSNVVGGVVSQLGTIATVGASVTGTYYVGLGNTPVEAFENYLLKVSGLTPVDSVDGNQTGPDKATRIQNIEKIFADAGLTVVKPTSISAPVEFKEGEVQYILDSELEDTEKLITEFIQKFASGQQQARVFEWEKDKTVNFGILQEVNGVVENHYISIRVG